MNEIKLNEKYYAVEHYNYNSYCIKEGVVVKTGKDAGTIRWTPIKYPVSIERVAALLFDMAVPRESWQNSDDFVAAIRDAEKNVLEQLRKIEHEFITSSTDD